MQICLYFPCLHNQSNVDLSKCNQLFLQYEETISMYFLHPTVTLKSYQCGMQRKMFSNVRNQFYEGHDLETLT